MVKKQWSNESSGELGGNRVRGDSEAGGEHRAKRRKVRTQGRNEQGSAGMALSKSRS